MEKEQWKDEVMNSLQGMKQAEPNAFLFTRIEAKLQKSVAIPQWQLRVAAIVLTVLMATNAFILFRKNNKMMLPVNQEYRLTNFQSY